MSGLVGMVNHDGAPVDPSLLREMTRHMAFRGPDAQASWTDAHVGLGHAMLRTTFEMANEEQPRSLDGRLWITADARIDARGALIQQLEGHGCRGLDEASDADLILHAYRVWDTDCVQHLLGDFSFAVWDAARQRLFCARDHFGVRPFYYASVGKCLIFSNCLDTIRRHPDVSNKLNDLAIVNLLLFHYQPRIDQTAFADIQSLMPAHILICEGDKVTTSRYWMLPIEEPLHYKQKQDYVDRFRELFDAAIADRMRTDRAGIQMSGGMDSCSIAATIHCLEAQRNRGCSLTAFTYVYDRLIPDQERHYAKLVADHLSMQIRFVVMDDKKWFDGWDHERIYFPEPMVNAGLWNARDLGAALDHDIRVFYCGWGPDSMLNDATNYMTLLRHAEVKEVGRVAGDFIRRHQDRPLVAARRVWERLRGHERDRPADAGARDLLAPTLSDDLIPKGWWQFPDRPPIHPWRPGTYASMTSLYWTIGFQEYDAANWRAPIEFRYPYFDIRLVEFLLRVPALPWFSNKRLLRESMRGRLPDEVRLRPKAPLAGKPQHPYADWVMRNNRPVDQLVKYINPSKIKYLTPRTDIESELALTNRLIAINHWLGHYNTADVA